MEDFIRLESLCKSFRQQPVLRGVDLSVAAGESIVIIGQSGSGKSVLLKHLIRLLSPDSGNVIVDGLDISELQPDELAALRRRFGMLFQSAALFDSMTVAENVGLGLVESRRLGRREVDEIVRTKLEMVNLADSADKRPAELSGGMRKRVGLARAIAYDPEVLLYDEPTTGLDPITADMINDLITHLHQSLRVTSVTVTHDMHSAFRIADRIVMLFDGRVLFSGTPDQIKANDDPYIQKFITSARYV